VTGTSRGVAVIGYGWMGRLHAQAYLRLRHRYPHLPAARLDAGLLRFVPPPADAVGEVPVPRDTSLGTGRTRAVLGTEPPSLLDTLRGLAIERRIADVRIAA
jgi:hypothetical protein